MSTSQSGLGKLKRDWSNASDSAASSSAELIEWEPTQRPKKPEPQTDDKMENANKRLLIIKQALASMNADKPAPAPVMKPLSKSAIADPNRPASKRPTLDQDDGAPVKKRRELPPSWRNDTLSDSGFKGRSWPTPRSSTQGSSSSTSTLNNSASSTSTKVNRVARVFLSQEQTHILRLVQEGCSIFYTGSAGAFVANTLIFYDMYFCVGCIRCWKIGPFTGNYLGYESQIPLNV
jgi:ATP-dependent DNA helicase PIF1